MVSTRILRRRFEELMQEVDAARAYERKMYDILGRKQHTALTDFISNKIYDFYAWRMNGAYRKGSRIQESIAVQLEELAQELRSEVRL